LAHKQAEKKQVSETLGVAIASIASCNSLACTVDSMACSPWQRMMGPTKLTILLIQVTLSETMANNPAVATLKLTLGG